MLDLHVHVLPGIDDGPRTLEDALALARALAEDGIEHIVATPHIYPGVFDNSATRIGEVFDQFQEAVSEAGIPLTMTWAAEVRICPEILEWIELRRLPMLNGSLVGPSTALIELPDGQIPVGTDKLMGLMLERGITPLVAHPERNKAVMEQPSRLEALRRMGCKFQLTAGSVLGDFGTRAQTTAQKLLDADWIDVIATDAHNRSSRKPRMSAARDWLAQQFDEALALRLTTTHPTEIAGVSSFAFQSGEQRLVFRDMPAAAAPLETTDQWSVDLMLGPDTLVAARPTGVPAAPDEHWSLIDFRIDALVDDLNSVSLHHDMPVAPGAFDTEPLSDLAPLAASDLPEDWQLPTFFDAPTSIPVPPPAVRRPPITATVVTPPTAPPVWAPAPTPPAPIVRPAPKPAPPPSPAVEVAVPVTMAAPIEMMPTATTTSAVAETPVVAVRGMRLSEMLPKEVSTAEVDPERVYTRAAPRTGSLAQAGHQAVRLPSLSEPITKVFQKAPAAFEQAVPPVPDGVRRGFRLSDLNPLPTRRR